MSTNEASNTGDITLSSKDLMQLITGGNLEGLDFMNMDPALAQQLIQLKSQQSQAADPNLNTAVGPRAPKHKTSRQPSRGTQVHGPYVEIVEQPKARGLRFRYECEGRSAGSIPGETSTQERKTFPAIKIHNYNGPAVIVVSCVTKDEPYKPHPHNLVGKDCKKGVCTLRIRDTTTVSFPHLGIQCAKKKDVDGNLKMRQDINVDPFQTGFKHKGQNIDLNVVRLCFQVFLPDDQGKITRIVQPVVSQAIHDKKALNDLVICRVDRTSGRCKGGDEVFLLCEKINRDDIRVRFYEEREGQVIWEGFGDFGQNDVHRQFAIVFKTPPYRDVFLQQPLECWMQLQRNSDLEGSDPIAFTYQPEDPDPDRILEKRKRKAAPLNYLQGGDNSGTISQETLKQRLKLKATRTTTASRGKQEPMSIKEEVRSPEMPQYSLNNLTSQNPQVSMASMQMPNASLLGGQSMSMAPNMNATIASQNSMSGGKIQYTSVGSPQQPQPQPQHSVTLNPQMAQILAQTGLFASPNQSSPVLQQPQAAGMQQVQQPDQQQQNEALKQLLLQVLANQANQGQVQVGQQPQVQLGQQNNPIVTNNDPNLQNQNQEMNSMEFMQSILNNPESLGSLTGAFASFDGLSGNMADLDCDPTNVAGFETVGGDSNQGTPQQFDETVTAVQNL